jgi:hypothetical protein
LALGKIQLQANRRRPLKDKPERIVELKGGTYDVSVIEIPRLPANLWTQVFRQILHRP